MSTLFQVDWQRVFFQVDLQQVFVPQTSVVELVLRGSLVYFVVVAILRFMPSRQVGGVGIADLLVVVLVATAAQDAMATDDSSITGGLILVTTIIGWSYLFNWVSYKVPHFQRFLNPSPLLLVKDGEISQQNMESGLINKRELMSQLRQQGVHTLSEVERAYIEGDGRISVFTKDLKKEDDKHGSQTLAKETLLKDLSEQQLE
ncbi:hypothetical protein AVDCRST_MAG94-3725 [uncultured Leptolyngbya sp.]|uniref:YetF C-terminal domain-containing protein n=1 Tax=uncultured Leptolyngbya sp. TaxID=332963 RepID=A0A6J4MQK6_9CYAN|nr:hypothetical protein AVDCRST_MAG94-3725 [uncultured Leptolyngbya sp.]